MNEHFELIVKLFERQFSQAYLQAPSRKRKQLYPFLSIIFRRWYYSALVEATPLTPANIVASVSSACENKAELYPSVSLRSKARWSGLRFHMTAYSTANHPVTVDLRAIVAYCSPSINLFDEDCFTDIQAIEAGEKLSLNDPHYASFLLEIAFRMRLLTKLPSIYANLAQTAKDASERLAVSNEALFDEIVETTVRMAASSLNETIPLPEPVFTEQFIRGLLKKPMITDEIFECVYDTLGFSMEDLFDEDLAEEFDGFDATLLTGTFITGIMLDKFFYTPFSYFLKLIRPIYVLPFDFSQELKYFLETPMEGDELASAFYAPCSKYTFTELGIKYFNIKATPENYFDAASFMPFEELKTKLLTQKALDILPIWAHEDMPEDFPFNPVKGRVLTFKIKLASEPAYWIQADIGEETTLHRFYSELLRYFYFTRDEEYSFFHGETENPFTEYGSAYRSRKVKNTSDIPLGELDFEYNKTLLLVHHQGDDMKRQIFKLRIDFLGEKTKEPRTLYPDVTKMSKAMRQLHEDDDEIMF